MLENFISIHAIFFLYRFHCSFIYSTRILFRISKIIQFEFTGVISKLSNLFDSFSQHKHCFSLYSISRNFFGELKKNGKCLWSSKGLILVISKINRNLFCNINEVRLSLLGKRKCKYKMILKYHEMNNSRNFFRWSIQQIQIIRFQPSGHSEQDKN